MSATDPGPRSFEDGAELKRSQRNFEAQSGFASTLLTEVEKTHPSQVASQGKRSGNLYKALVDTAPAETGIDAVYAAKAQILNEAMLDIGMGKYQWFLFICTSVGWFLDQFWVMSFLIIAPAASVEAQFFYTSNKKDYLFISQFAGLTAGALVWPIMADHLGRKWIFTSTLVLMGMGGLVGAGMPAFTGLCVVGFVVGIAVSGNQAVDAMYLLESLPGSHQFLVALQGLFWASGQLVASAVGYAFIEKFTCGTGPDSESTASSFSKRQHTGSGSSSSGSSSSSTGTSSTSSSSCHYVSNKGWRYVWWTFGCITIFLYLCRFLFAMRSSPKFLLSKRRDAEATQTVRDMAAYNNRPTWLQEASFARIDSTIDAEDANNRRKSPFSAVLATLKPTGFALLLLLWAVTGLTFPLYNNYIQSYLSTKGVHKVDADTVTRPYLYSRYIYIALAGIPGPIFAALLIETKVMGRKRTGALVALLTGIIMLISTVSRSRGAWLAFQCVLSCLYFAGLAIITTYTVEVFAAPVRGHGVGLTGFAWRLFGLIATIIYTFDGSAVSGGAPVWFCGAIWILMAGAWVLLPIETVAKAAT